MTGSQKSAIGLASTVVILSRLCHLRLIWVEEAYGMAAASELLRGKHLYSDVWFDKPPIYAWFYLLSGAMPGWPLRFLDIVFTLTLAWAFAKLVRALWRPEPRSWEAVLAFVLTCFSLTFWIPSAVMAIAPDQLVLLPMVIGVTFAVEGSPAFAGIATGFAVLCNPKGLIALPIVLFWCWRDLVSVLAGFVGVQSIASVTLPVRPYWVEVWRWGIRYSADSFITDPVMEGFRRTVAWIGFHLTIVAGSLVCLVKVRSYKIWAWLLISCIAVIGGVRFFPRYYFLLLPVVIVSASHGLLLLSRVPRIILLCLLSIPLVRFGPRYVTVALKGSANWSDTTLMQDSRAVASALSQAGAHADDTLLVWGYRPDIYVFSGLGTGTRFLDCQPLTGVIADRHLTVSKSTFPELAAQNRQELTKTRPQFIIDGLGPLNPALAISRYTDLRDWWSQYERIASTSYSVVYRRREQRNSAR